MPGDEYIPAVLVPSQADIVRRIQREEASAQRVALNAIGDQLGAFADEIRGLIQAPWVLSPKGGDLDMADHRMRVCVGYNDDGSPVTQRVRADSEIEMADKIVRIMLHPRAAPSFFLTIITLLRVRLRKQLHLHPRFATIQKNGGEPIRTASSVRTRKTVSARISVFISIRRGMIRRSTRSAPRTSRSF